MAPAKAGALLLLKTLFIGIILSGFDGIRAADNIMKVYDIANGFNDVSREWIPGKNFYWIVSDAEDIALIKEKIELDDDSIEECKNLQQSAKINFFTGYIFIVFNILEYKDEDVISRELNIFLGKDFVITIFKEYSDIIEELIKDITEGKKSFVLKEVPRPYILLYYILDRIIVRNYNIISDLEAQADRIEISILKSPKAEYGRELIKLRRQIYKIRKFLNPLRYIGDSLLINDNKIIDNENIKYFESLDVKISKLLQAFENLIQDIALVRETYESEISNKTNELMKIFTIIAAVFLPLDLISGLFGMSIEHMPLRNHEYGYYIIIGFMAGIVLLLICLFKKKRWL